MCDYIERQWLAFCGGWGATLCADLRLLMLTWLNQDADVLYTRRCVCHSLCHDHSSFLFEFRSRCWVQHLLQPGRRDVHMLLVQTDGYNLRSLTTQQQTEEVCLAAVQQNGWALEFVCNQTKAIVDAALNQQPGAKCFCKDLNFYSCMVDYIEQQWLALCDVNEWGSVLCRDLRLLLLTWLNQDHDVLYARMCVPDAPCDKHPRNRSECWGQHLLQPGRRDIHMLLVQCNSFILCTLTKEQQTEEVCLAAVGNGYVLAWVHNQTKAVVDAALNQDPDAKRYVWI